MGKLKLMWIVWPSFLVAGVGWAVFFTLVDPADLPHAEVFTVGESRVVIYSVGFLGLWLLAAASSAFTLYLQEKPPARGSATGASRQS